MRFAAAFVLMLALSACNTSKTLDVKRTANPLPQRYAAIMVDTGTKQALYSDHADDLRFPASLTKMMTLYLLFEALETGRVSSSTQMPVSSFAAGQAPSKLGLKAGQTLDVDTAISALAVKSANDAAVVVAEHLGGSESAFAAAMTSKARALGMNRTTFRNASGLPDSAQVTTARDMAVLGMALRERFPQHFTRFSARTFAYAGREVRGHNRALDMIDGADGIKTGYTRASGFNLVTSANRGGKTVVGVVMGEDSAKVRDARMLALFDKYAPKRKAAAETPGF